MPALRETEREVSCGTYCDLRCVSLRRGLFYGVVPVGELLELDAGMLRLLGNEV